MSTLFDLGGKTALVTGSSRGIGRAIAEALAAHGANVVISSRKQDACEAVANAINGRHRGRAAAIAASISSKPELELLVEHTCSQFGRIDILVCNAATNPYYGPSLAISDPQFQKILNNNILADHWLAQLAAPGMIAAGSGSIIFIASIGGYRGSAVLGAYNISKAATLQLARNLAVELGPHKITVNCISPGLIRTDFASALWQNEALVSDVLKGIPLGRIGEADDIAGTAVFLASPAGRYITGQSIVIDGGSTATSREF